MRRITGIVTGLILCLMLVFGSSGKMRAHAEEPSPVPTPTATEGEEKEAEPTPVTTPGDTPTEGEEPGDEEEPGDAEDPGDPEGEDEGISIKDADVTLLLNNTVYTGSVQVQKVVSVKLNRKQLTENVDYIVDPTSRLRATEVGTYQVKIRGIGEYMGLLTVEWSIVAPSPTPTPDPDLPTATPTESPEPTGEPLPSGASPTGEPLPSGASPSPTVYVTPTDFPTPTPLPGNGFEVKGVEGKLYTGEKIYQDDMQVYFDGLLLTKGKDYKVSYRNNVNAGVATIVITGKNNIKGTQEVDFSIYPLDMGECCTTTDIVVPVGASSSAKTPVVMWGKKALKRGRDFQMDIWPNEMKEATTYGVILTGSGNFTGRLAVRVTLMEGVDIRNVRVSKIHDQNWSGYAITPPVAVTYKGAAITTGFDISYEDNVDAGFAYVVITANGKALPDGTVFAGQLKRSFRIVGRKISSARIRLGKVVYTGGFVIPEVTVKVAEKELVQDRDYTVSFSNNRHVGKAEAIITGIGSYSGTVKRSFEIKPCSLTKREVEIRLPARVYYEKGGTEPKPEVLYNGNRLMKGRDYTVSYSDKRNAGDIITVTVEGVNNYQGTVKTEVACIAKPIEETISLTKDPVYKDGTTSRRYLSKPVLMDSNGKKLQAGVDFEKSYTYTYANGNAVDPTDVISMGRRIYITIRGKGNYTGTKMIEIRAVAKNMSTVQCKVAPQTYTGYEIMPTYLDFVTNIESTQYEIVGYRKNVNVGTGTVILHGLGEYGSYKYVKFKIVKYKVQ
ncbi:MAG: hypothetical protein K6E50_14660 [Lachnospiraceae bacterium]|nr:hypothetical protein [Lachnospiraceae bacterium]